LKADLDAVNDSGMLGVRRLRETWSNARYGRRHDDPAEFHFDRLVLHALGVGLEQAMQYVGQSAPTFEEFERWITATAGEPTASQVARINAAEAGRDYPDEVRYPLGKIETDAPVLSADDLAFWDEHGYVVVADAVPTGAREQAVRAILTHLAQRRTTRNRGTRSAPTASWCNISSIRRSRPSATRGVSTRHSPNSGGPLICG
jgi:hypothetical protein